MIPVTYDEAEWPAGRREWIAVVVRPSSTAAPTRAAQLVCALSPLPAGAGRRPLGASRLGPPGLPAAPFASSSWSSWRRGAEPRTWSSSTSCSGLAGRRLPPDRALRDRPDPAGACADASTRAPSPLMSRHGLCRATAAGTFPCGGGRGLRGDIKWPNRTHYGRLRDAVRSWRRFSELASTSIARWVVDAR